MQNELQNSRSQKRTLRLLDGQEADTAESLYQITLEANAGHTTWKTSSFQYELENKQNFYLGYQVGEKLVGFIGCTFVADEASINNFAVSPEYKKQGIGSLLLERLIQEAKNRNVQHFYLEVRVSNEPAISLYKKFGFEKIAFRRDYYVEPVEDAYVLYLRMEEPV